MFGIKECYQSRHGGAFFVGRRGTRTSPYLLDVLQVLQLVPWHRPSLTLPPSSSMLHRYVNRRMVAPPRC